MSTSDHSSLTSCNDEPVVGGIFNGSIITNVEVEVTDRGRNLKKRFLLTLEGGMMAIDDRYVPKSKVLEVEASDNDGSCSSFHSFTFEGMELPESAKGIYAIKVQKERERQERRQKRAEKQKRRESLKKEKEHTENEGTRQGAEPGKSRSDDTIVADNTATAKTTTKKKVAVVSKITKVFPETDQTSSDGGAIAVWKFPSPCDVPNNVGLWAPVDVCLLPMGKNDINDENADEKSRELTGLWGYAPRAGSRHDKPPVSSSSSHKSTTTTSPSSAPWSFKATKDVWVYPPNLTPPSDFPVHGTYRFAPVKNGKKKTKFKWPPPIDPAKKIERRVNRLRELPRLFSNSPALPMSILAYSKKNVPSNDENCHNAAITSKDVPEDGQNVTKTGLTAVWTYLEGHEEEDDDWVAQEVQLFPPGQSPSLNNDESLPQGTWVIYEDDATDSNGDSDSIIQPYNPQNRWIDARKHPKVHLFVPGQTPDIEREPVVATGTWTYAKNSIKRKWPPPTTDEVKKLRNIGKVNIPKIFQRETFRPLTVYSKDCPDNPKCEFAKERKQLGSTDDPTAKALNHRLPDSAVTGEWAFYDGENEDPNGEWQPVNVIIYAPDEAPKSPNNAQGIWTIHDADPHQIFVHAPGFEFNPADESVLASGVWTFHSGDEDSTSDDKWLMSWPPPKKPVERQVQWAPPGKAPREEWKSHQIRVVPEASVHNERFGNEAALVTGIWKFNDAPPDDFSDWVPQDLMIYQQGKEPSKDKIEGPSGLWGIYSGCECNEDGLWVAEEIWVFPPDEEESIPENCVIQGTWTYPPTQKNVHWPPKTKESALKTTQIETIPKWDPNGHGSEWKPQKVTVVPKNTVAKTDSSPQGIWMFSDGQEPGNLNEWNAMEVVVYPKGAEPDCSYGRPTGVWGYYKDAIQDEYGEWAADALVFCAPGVDPGDDIVVRGHWAFFDDETDWPLECEPFEAKELPQEERVNQKPPKAPKTVAKKPEIVPQKELLSPMDRAKLRVLPVKSPEKNPIFEDERHIAILSKYQSAFDVANRPKKISSKRSLIRKKYKK
ncbi:hypothetical protein IV203_014999 [Nitzschia inconspicua]|uniref:Uncharacterized protein n=1 Tax=Nitzschia inconspicua TaxID=303405 RepID=A0A9K3LCX5_9STRA|nr:hypothetical protein IV203_014999 [Nitzschia inconspicua]